MRSGCIGFALVLLLFLYGCNPPANYYQQVLEMERYGEQVRQDTGRNPGEIIAPVRDSEPLMTSKSPVQQLTKEEPQEQPEETVVVEQQEEEIQEKPPVRETIRETPTPTPQTTEPIALSPDVIKSALKAANPPIIARNVELINGRPSGGKNSVRINFLCKSVDAIDNNFVITCAVLYYLNEQSKTIDVVVGLAEGEQADLLAILQSNMNDIAAWMSKDISRLEWYSMVTKKTL